MIPIRKGQAMIKTECGICGLVRSDPTKACAHINRHPRKPRKGQNNPPEEAKTFNTDPTFGGTRAIPDHLVCSPSCMDRGEPWASTACLCDCHYQGLTARQMVKANGGEHE